MPFAMQNIKTLACLSIAALATGCGSSATLTLRDGQTIEGIIRASSSENVYVTKFGDVKRVPRSEIADIDHPGNVAATIGGVVTAYGIANIIIGMPTCERTENPAYCAGVVLPAVLGLGLVTYGVSVWAESTRNAEAPNSNGTGSRVFVAPMASCDKKDKVFGASALVSF